MTTIPLFDAAAVHAGLDSAGTVRGVLDSQRYVLGAQVRAFEAAFAAYHGVAHCVGVGNGTDALELALRALGVRAGSRVVTVANAGCYASTAIHALGAQPVYVEVDEATLTLSPAALARALESGPRPSAVVVTHLYGLLADMDALVPLCRAHGVPLVEDCAQAHGAQRHGRKAGSQGALACFSFYPTKNLGALGDGGAVIGSDAALADKVRALGQYGWARKYLVAAPGGRNSRLDEIQAAVLLAKLPLLGAHNAWRRSIAARYSAAFAALPLRLPVSVGEDHAMHLYVVRDIQRGTQRDPLRQHLTAQGIATDVHFPIADHLQPAYAGTTQAAGPLPVTEAACASVLSLPCYPGLDDASVARVIAAVQTFFHPC